MKEELRGKNNKEERNVALDPPALSVRRAGLVTGQSVIEVLVALALLAIGLIAAIIVVFGGQSLSIDTRQNQKAIAIARENLEFAEDEARQDFHGIAYSSSTDGIFLKEIIVEPVSSDMTKIVSRVSWQIDPLRTQKIELTTLVTNWKLEQATGGDTGGDPPFGDWRNPQTLGSVDLGPGNQATDIDVVNKIVFLSAEASAPAKPDFFVVDATNGQSPFIVSSINTGSSLNALDVTGTHAYLANRDVNAQLQVVDVANIASPLLVASLKLPGVSGTGGIGHSIFYYNSRVYVGTKKATGPEFHIIDVSNPTNPISLGSREIGYDVNFIHVNGTTAYIATSDDVQELKILNVSDPALISQIGFYNAPGSEDAISVYFSESKLYLGRVDASANELYILDITSSTPQLLGSQNFSTDITGIIARDFLGFFGTTDSNKEFQVWNVSSSASLEFWSGFNFPQVATGLDYEDNLVYVAVRSNDALRIITSAP